MHAEELELIGPDDLPDYRAQANEIARASWPEFMLHDSVADEHWHALFDSFRDYQFGLYDAGRKILAAMGNSLPFHWERPLEELPEGGWEWVFGQAVRDCREGRAPNIQSAIQVAIRPEYQGRGLSTRMIAAMREIGKAKGFRSLVAPVRPNEKARYPLIDIEDYILWMDAEGLPFDAWLRVHVRAGARIVKACRASMRITGRRADWEAWTGLKFPQSASYIVPGALNPIELDVEKDEGLYVEPNVWVVHPLVPA
jgi:GNAT superfamily N-acetyltransferase